MTVNLELEKEIIFYTTTLVFILKIVVFILGFLIVKMGYSLIRDGVKGSFKFTTETKGIKGALESSSPGLLFVLLGIILIGYAIFLDKGVNSSKEESGGNETHSYENEIKQGHDVKKPTKPALVIDTTKNNRNIQ